MALPFNVHFRGQGSIMQVDFELYSQQRNIEFFLILTLDYSASTAVTQSSEKLKTKLYSLLIKHVQSLPKSTPSEMNTVKNIRPALPTIHRTVIYSFS